MKLQAPQVTVAPEGSRNYVGEEGRDTLVVLDGKTLRETERIPLSGTPNLVDITPDRKRIYVAITLSWTDLSNFPEIKAAPTGGVDVIDATSLENIKTIQIRGGIHDLNVTPDGKNVVAGSARGAVKEVALIPVGFAPARNIAWIAP